MQPRNFSFSFGFLWTVLACTLLPGTSPIRVSMQTEAVFRTARRGTSPNKPSATGSGSRSRSTRWRSWIDDGLSRFGACRTALCRRADLRDLPTRFIGVLCRTALPAGRVDRSGHRAPLRPAGRYRRLAGAGQANLAEELFRKIDTAGMTPGEYRAWHSRCSARCGFAPIRRSRVDSLSEERAWAIRCSPYQELFPCWGCIDQTRTRTLRGLQKRNGMLRRGPEAARTADGQNLSHQNFALVYYWMMHIAKGRATRTGCSIIWPSPPYPTQRAAPAPYSSLHDLALELFDRKDYDRATAYMGSTLRRDPLQIGDGFPTPLRRW